MWFVPRRTNLISCCARVVVLVIALQAITPMGKSGSFLLRQDTCHRWSWCKYQGFKSWIYPISNGTKRAILLLGTNCRLQYDVEILRYGGSQRHRLAQNPLSFLFYCNYASTTSLFEMCICILPLNSLRITPPFYWYLPALRALRLLWWFGTVPGLCIW